MRNSIRVVKKKIKHNVLYNAHALQLPNHVIQTRGNLLITNRRRS